MQSYAGTQLIGASKEISDINALEPIVLDKHTLMDMIKASQQPFSQGAFADLHNSHSIPQCSPSGRILSQSMLTLISDISLLAPIS
jgi:hypothetical protein